MKGMFQFQVTIPFKVAEVPKNKPELEVFETVLTFTIRWCPPSLDSLPSLHLFHRWRIPILKAKVSVLIL